MSATEFTESGASDFNLADLVTKNQQEVIRQMQICNACRYCEGLCAVFPAMELRRDFTGGDADYLANLCHNCGACYYDCQYAPPHEFGVNVPVALANLREETYARHAWPSGSQRFFEQNGLWVALTSALGVALFIAGFAAFAAPGALFATGTEPGAFYRIMPHNAMVVIFGGVFLYAIYAIIMSARSLWSAPGKLESVSLRSVLTAIHDACTLRYLDGGGMGCMDENERPSDARRLYHHMTFYGFLLCFAATSAGTIMHYFMTWEAPYPWWSPPVILGTLGGIGLIVGPFGLLQIAQRRDQPIRPDTQTGMSAAFLWMLILVSATGLALLVFRSTSAMGLLLAVHLGVVFALFLSFPYGKFVHGIHRFMALVRHAHEQKNHN
ncbi:MAG: tricarballylate utilization 4Fe-4S protein TcuB [Pseudomonadota bacterium]